MKYLLVSCADYAHPRRHSLHAAFLVLYQKLEELDALFWPAGLAGARTEFCISGNQLR